MGSDTCYVICPSLESADHCIAKIQELAVPKRAAYGSLFGATFLWSGRSSLFISHATLDFALEESKCWVFTTGWQADVETEEFLMIVRQLQLLPVRAFSHEAGNSRSFFMLFDNMDRAKHAMKKLRRLRWRWRIKRETAFLAYPRRADVHSYSENDEDPEK